MIGQIRPPHAGVIPDGETWVGKRNGVIISR